LGVPVLGAFSCRPGSGSGYGKTNREWLQDQDQKENEARNGISIFYADDSRESKNRARILLFTDDAGLEASFLFNNLQQPGLFISIARFISFLNPSGHVTVREAGQGRIN